MSTTTTIPIWQEENRTLHDTICQARVNKNAATTLKEVLDIHKNKFLMLLDSEEAKNAHHRTMLKSNKAYNLNGVSHPVNTEFVTRALFLSDQLNINEHIAATLLAQATSSVPRVSTNSIDAAVLLYHEERSYLLACLDVIVKSAKDASLSDPIRSVCNEFILDLVHFNNNAFVPKLLDTLNQLALTMDSIANTVIDELGCQIADVRSKSLQNERLYIVQIICHIVSFCDIAAKDKIRMLHMLEKARLSDPTTAYLIIAMVSALSYDDEIDAMFTSVPTMQFISDFHHRIMSHESEEPFIKAVVVLQWVLYLSGHARNNAHFIRQQENDIKELINQAIATDVFRFINDYLLYFQQPDNAKISTEKKADFLPDFQPFVIYELEKLGVLVISHVFDTLKDLKYKEEDTNLPVQTTDSALLSSNSSNANQCHDLEYFLTFLASVFRNRVNAGVVFWNREQGGLHHFTRWLQDIKVIDTVCAAFDFLASITTGDDCATHMFNLFKEDTMMPLEASSVLFSWGKPLAALIFYANQLKDKPNAIIPPKEEQVILQFLNLFKQCVQYSREARITFWFDPEISAQIILINILKCSISTHLRATLFDVLASFCSAWGGGIDGVGREISCQVWKILESNDLFLDAQRITQQQEGTQSTLAEKRSRVYVETVSEVRLIASAIHSQSKREALISGFREAPSSIPLEDWGEQGSSKKPRSSTPFISLVMDDILDCFTKQEHKFANDRWKLREACLSVMENSIAALGIQDKELKAETLDSSMKARLVDYYWHPGFQVLIRILSGGHIVNTIFFIIETCAALETKYVESTLYAVQCLVRCLRIIYKALQLQHVFCDIWVPYLSEITIHKALPGFAIMHLPRRLFHMDQLVHSDNKILHSISLLIDHPNQEEVCFLSARIMHLLTTSKCGSLVVKSLLSSDGHALAVRLGISKRLNTHQPEIITCDDYEYDINNIPFWLAKDTMENSYNHPSNFSHRLNTSVSIALINLLMDNSEQKSAPNLAEFLLGYTEKQDAESNQANLVCLHAILNMLRQGVDKEVTMMDDTAEPSQLMIDTHPILGEKCYHLIYQLCAKESFSTWLMEYLRQRENFFYKQFNSMSSRVEHNIEVVDSSACSGTMVCSDGTTCKTDFSKLSSKLFQRACLMHSLALELHQTVATKQKNETSKLLGLLYGPQSVLSPNDMDTEAGQSDFRNNDQHLHALTKMLEFIRSLDFTWVDDLVKNHEAALKLQYFTDFDPARFQATTRSGYTLYNIPDIYKHLSHVKDDRFFEDPQLNDIEMEMGNILSWAMAQNHVREITQAKLQCIHAWGRVVHVTLTECFDLIDGLYRQEIVYELLKTILSAILHHAKSFSGHHMLKGPKAVVMALVDHVGTQHLPVEKSGFIFTSIVNCICGTNTVVRGDMYSVLTSFFLYINKLKDRPTIQQLQQFIVDTITAQESTLLSIMCQDATNGLNVCKTTAYIAIDMLNKCALTAGSTSVLLYLVQKNFLHLTIESIKYDDASLSRLLVAPNAHLLPLHLFEAKMSILLCFVTNANATELLSSSYYILNVLARCQFLKKSQLLNTSITRMNLEHSMELSNRYQRLVMPTLELIVAFLITYGAKNDEILKKTETWVRNQQLALTSILDYKGRPVTLTLLKQLQLVKTIVYFMSCRKGYLKDITTRGINQLHKKMLKFEISDALFESFIPKNNDESIEDATKIIKFIYRNAHAYRNLK